MWDSVVGQMLDEIEGGGARDETYWAQQLAFGPVLLHALRLHFRGGAPPPEQAARLVRMLRLALDALAALPEPTGEDPAALRLIAQRQSRALSWGRRRSLHRMLARLGGDGPGAEFVPRRHLRAYPLLGWRPGERLAQ